MKVLPHTSLFFLALFLTPVSHAALTNYNSMMLGDRAGGMGGAATALTGDSAAAAYYNPATLARLEGSSLSTAVNLFNKYDVTYGSQSKLGDAIFRINKGSIVSVPSATGIFSNFRNFAAGLSIVIPNYETFGGDIQSSGQTSTFLHVSDESIWIGGALAFNWDDKQSLGFTTYYTSRTFSRSLTNRYDTGSEIIAENEERAFSSNSVIYTLGYFLELSENWRFGASYRFPSIPIAGVGSYMSSSIGTVSGAQPITRNYHIHSQTYHPDSLSIGVAFEEVNNFTLSFDLRHSGANKYSEMPGYTRAFRHHEIYNAALGFEKHLEKWLALRIGIFTDYSASQLIPTQPDRQFEDHVDKIGFSANLRINTTAHTSISLGGYYLGGTGFASEKIGANFQRIAKSDRLFSFAMGSSYSF